MEIEAETSSWRSNTNYERRAGPGAESLDNLFQRKLLIIVVLPIYIYQFLYNIHDFGLQKHNNVDLKPVVKRDGRRT